MRVLIICGLSGGHIFPALALKEELRRVWQDSKIQLIQQSPTFDLQLSGQAKKIPIFNLLQVSFKTLVAILVFHPQVIVGFGGYTSLPAMLLAYLFRIPRVIHEQNVLPGEANRLLANLAEAVALGFPESKRYFLQPYNFFILRYKGIDERRLIVTGNPLDLKPNKDKDDAIKWLGLSERRFTILVMGGSQGSHFLNLRFLEALRLMPDISRALQVIHLCGNKDYSQFSLEYAKIDIDYRLFSFLKEISYAYKASDLVISRAGALSISEIALCGLPSILVPYPYARAHQFYNAKVLADKGAAVLIEQRELSAKRLRDEIYALISDKQRLIDMGNKSQKLANPYASQNLAKLVASLIN